MEDKKLSLVILAAGKGTRFLPLTAATPKPLLKVAGKAPLEYTIESLLPSINELILVVGYLKEKFVQYFGDSYKGVPIKYVEQTEQRGTAHALITAGEVISNERFILTYGDDLYEKQVFENLLDQNLAVVGMIEENWQSFGVLKVKNNNTLDEIVEKPQTFVGNLVNIGVYLLSKQIFSYKSQVTESIRGELELTDLVSFFARENEINVVEVKSGWTPLSYPWNLLNANKDKILEIEDERLGIIEEGVTIKGKLRLGKGSIIKSGAYLEGNFIIGENCVIGPNCALSEFVQMGDNVLIGNAVEVKRSLLGNNVNIKHLSYIADSILGNSVNIGGGTITANLRHDQTTVRVMTNGQLIDSGMQKLGAIFGDGVKTGINTSLNPGVKLASGITTLPGEVVNKDKVS